MDRTYTVDELIGALKRRWKIMALVAGGALALATIAIARIPNEYSARALVMVEGLHPHPDLVVPVISTSLEERVKNVRSQVYARGLLTTTIEELKLYPKEREKNGMDAAVEALRKDTEVHAEGEDAFSVTVRSKDKEEAARTANRLAELFIETNLQVRAGQVTRTRDIISQKLAEMRGDLSKSEGKLIAYKREHANELPELVESRIHEREQLSKQIEIEATFMNEAKHRLDLIGTQPSGKDTEVGRLEEEYDNSRAKLSAATAHLTADNPDVIEQQRETQATLGRLQTARARAAQNDLESRRMNEAVNRGQKRVTDLEARQDRIDRVVAVSPQIAVQVNEMDRDIDVLKAKVISLTSKKAEAEIAADLEARSAPTEFRVLESASPPSLPGSPNRPQFFLLALLGALALGSAIALGQELADRSLRSESEVGTAIALPVLACIPRLAVAGQRAPRLLTINAGREA